MFVLIIIIVILAGVVGQILFREIIFLALRRCLHAEEGATADRQRLSIQLIHSCGNISPELQSPFFPDTAQAQQSMSHNVAREPGIAHTPGDRL